MGGLLEHAAAAAAEAVTTIATAAAAASEDVPGDWQVGLDSLVVVIEGKGGGLIFG